MPRSSPARRAKASADKCARLRTQRGLVSTICIGRGMNASSSPDRAAATVDTDPTQTLMADDAFAQRIAAILAEAVAKTSALDPEYLKTRDPDYLMTIEEVAEFFRVPLGTVRKWREKKSGPPASMIGVKLRFRRGDVIAWFESRRVV